MYTNEVSSATSFFFTSTAGGRVTASGLPGRVSVMVRYQGRVAVFAAAVPLGAPVTDLPPVRTFVDEAVFANLKELGIPPSPVCDDGTFLRRVTLDEALARAIREDYENAPISATDRAMLDYASKVTTQANRMTRKDHDTLAAHGFDDRARLQITLIAAFFNYINRVADSLGTGEEE